MTLPLTCFAPLFIGRNPRKRLFLLGEPGGTRTHDPLIKSQVLYRLSYGLRVACVGAGLRPVNSGTGGFPAGIPQVPVNPANGTPPAGLAIKMFRSGTVAP